MNGSFYRRDRIQQLLHCAVWTDERTVATSKENRDHECKSEREKRDGEKNDAKADCISEHHLE